MSTSTVQIPSARRTRELDLGPILVSDLPPVTDLGPSFTQRVSATLRKRRQVRAFERTLRNANPNEHADLLAQSRR